MPCWSIGDRQRGGAVRPMGRCEPAGGGGLLAPVWRGMYGRRWRRVLALARRIHRINAREFGPLRLAFVPPGSVGERGRWTFARIRRGQPAVGERGMRTSPIESASQAQAAVSAESVAEDRARACVWVGR